MKGFKFFTAAVVFAAAAIPVGFATTASAEVMVSGRGGFCFDVNMSNNLVALWTCHGGANQNFFTSAYGEQRFNGMCLTGNNKNEQLRLTACNGSRGQKWGLQANGELKNETGWCADIPNDQAYQGQKVMMWDCNGGRNQKFGRGGFKQASAVSGGAAAARAPQGSAFTIAGGAGIVAAGGGNIVAAGGGNIVAAGGGNIIQMTGGSIVAAGGGN
jgi:hypothetical protein